MVVFFLLFCVKTTSSSGFQSSQRNYDFEKPENITYLYMCIGNQIGQSEKNSVIRSYRKPLEPGFKLKIQLLAEFYPPSVWHKIRWYPWTIGKSVFQTNDTKELKTQGAECQGPDIPKYHWSGGFLFQKVFMPKIKCLNETCSEGYFSKGFFFSFFFFFFLSDRLFTSFHPSLLANVDN